MDPRPYIDVLNIPDLYKPVSPKVGRGKIKVVGEAKGGKRERGGGAGDRERQSGIRSSQKYIFLPNLNDKICHKH